MGRFSRGPLPRLGWTLGEHGTSPPKKMKSPMGFYKRLRISTQLALWFLLIALAPFACVVYFTYRHSVDSLYAESLTIFRRYRSGRLIRSSVGRWSASGISLRWRG